MLVLKLMPDYECEFPLWTRDQVVGHVRFNADQAASLGLPSNLIDQLSNWQAQFDDGFHHRRGWTNDDDRLLWTRTSERLIAQLVRHLPKDVALEIDLWPIE